MAQQEREQEEKMRPRERKGDRRAERQRKEGRNKFTARNPVDLSRGFQQWQRRNKTRSVGEMKWIALRDRNKVVMESMTTIFLWNFPDVVTKEDISRILNRIEKLMDISFPRKGKKMDPVSILQGLEEKQIDTN